MRREGRGGGERGAAERGARETERAADDPLPLPGHGESRQQPEQSEDVAAEIESEDRRRDQRRRRKQARTEIPEFSASAAREGGA